MAKNAKPKTTYVERASVSMREARRNEEIARGGRPRSWVASNGKAKASKTACRGKNFD